MKKIFVLLFIAIAFNILVIGCIEKQELSTTPATNEPTPTPPPTMLPQPDSKYSYYLNDWEPNDISNLSYGICLGDTNGAGYSIPLGSTMYYLNNNVTKIYAIDNSLILSVNEADIESKIVQRSFADGTRTKTTPTQSLTVPNGSAIEQKKFIGFIFDGPGSTRVTLMRVKLNADCDETKITDLSSDAIGIWEPVGGDMDICKVNSQQPKILCSNWYSIQPDTTGNTIISWHADGDLSSSTAIANNNMICFETNDVNVFFRIYDQYNAFVAFYEASNSYVQQLVKLSND